MKGDSTFDKLADTSDSACYRNKDIKKPRAGIAKFLSARGRRVKRLMPAFYGRAFANSTPPHGVKP